MAKRINFSEKLNNLRNDVIKEIISLYLEYKKNGKYNVTDKDGEGIYVGVEEYDDTTDTAYTETYEIKYLTFKDGKLHFVSDDEYNVSFTDEDFSLNTLIGFYEEITRFLEV